MRSFGHVLDSYSKNISNYLSKINLAHSPPLTGSTNRDNCAIFDKENGHQEEFRLLPLPIWLSPEWLGLTRGMQVKALVLIEGADLARSEQKGEAEGQVRETLNPWNICPLRSIKAI
jgi:hypothetical protein